MISMRAEYSIFRLQNSLAVGEQKNRRTQIPCPWTASIFTQSGLCTWENLVLQRSVCLRYSSDCFLFWKYLHSFQNISILITTCQQSADRKVLACSCDKNAILVLCNFRVLLSWLLCITVWHQMPKKKVLVNTNRKLEVTSMKIITATCRENIGQ